MAEIILKAENISKQYRLGLVGTGTLSHDLNRWWHFVRGKEDPYLKVGVQSDRSKKANSDYVWALKDINFEVKRGEVLGIIGKNGAGKSTLLKILSRVTSPTTGQIRSKGRIASLLEVGTGFHPELTGLENIYLNGAILGMTKKEIKQKEEEIIDFSGCAQYIDTPVKRYSSGMRVRLAFAVAAFLEPDILVVDEVLAVGDAEFQKKAVGKMQDISKGDGRTVLFVSHNMAAVRSLCSKTILLDNGIIKYEGATEMAVDEYLRSSYDSLISNFTRLNLAEFNGLGLNILSLGIRGMNSDYEAQITRNDELILEILIEKHIEDGINFIFIFKDENGNIILTANNHHSSFKIPRTGKHKVCLNLPKLFFNEGTFFVDFGLTKKGSKIFGKKDVLSFIVLPEIKKVGEWMGKEPGPIKMIFEWNSELIND